VGGDSADCGAPGRQRVGESEVRLRAASGVCAQFGPPQPGIRKFLAYPRLDQRYGRLQLRERGAPCSVNGQKHGALARLSIEIEVEGRFGTHAIVDRAIEGVENVARSVRLYGVDGLVDNP